MSDQYRLHRCSAYVTRPSHSVKFTDSISAGAKLNVDSSLSKTQSMDIGSTLSTALYMPTSAASWTAIQSLKSFAELRSNGAQTVFAKQQQHHIPE